MLIDNCNFFSVKYWDLFEWSLADREKLTDYQNILPS